MLTMNKRKDYSIDLDVKYNSLEVVEVSELITNSLKKWQNYSLSLVNDCVVRLGVIEGEFHWHKHEDGDEFFYVLEGELIIEYEEKKITLLPGQGFNIPKGV